ncbi:flagellar hook-length control protein FliK [Magnetococcales bacterium HHB-1]
MMIISDVLSLDAPKAQRSQSSADRSDLTPGRTFSARVTQVDGEGRGTLKLPDGRALGFSGGRGLSVGENVRFEVVRQSSDQNIALRVISSERGVAQQMAGQLQQSVLRAPDVFAKLLPHLQQGSSSLPSSSSSAAQSMRAFLSESQAVHTTEKTSGAQEKTVLSIQNRTLSQTLAKILPSVSWRSSMQGNLSQWVDVFGPRNDFSSMAQQMREAAGALQQVGGLPAGLAAPDGEVQDVARAVRGALNRMADLVAAQELLPRQHQDAGEQAIFGYRVFWLEDGGLGEAIWRREQKKRGMHGDDAEGYSVLLSLQLTALGAVQSRISYMDGQMNIALAAEDEGALAALRRDLSELRAALQQNEEGPLLHALDLTKLFPKAFYQERQEFLGLEEEQQFAAQV